MPVSLVVGIWVALAIPAAAWLVAEHYGLGWNYWLHYGPARRANARAAARIRIGWRRRARNLGLCLREQPDMRAIRDALHRGKVRGVRIHTPAIRRVGTDRFGVNLDMATIDGVGLDEFTAKAPYLANAWRMARVAVRQDSSGLIRVRAVRIDPLTITTTAGFPAVPATLDRVRVGVDDYGEPVYVRLKNLSGLGVYGGTGYGKTSFMLGLVCALATSPAVQILVADGKNSTGHEGDWAGLAPRLVSLVGDDLPTVRELLEQVVVERKRRAAAILEELGTPNFWDVEPSPDWPLIVVVIDECHTFFEQIPNSDAVAKAHNADAAAIVRACQDLAKKGRSAGIYLIPATQKGTGDAVPTRLRDVLPASLSFAVRTLAAARAALGDAINEFPDANPVNFQRDEYRGVASMVREGLPGFVRFRNPFTSPALATQVGAATADLARDIPGITIGTTHRVVIPDTVEALTRHQGPRR